MRHASGCSGVTAGIYMGVRGPQLLPARTRLQGYFVWKVDSEQLLPPKGFHRFCLGSSWWNARFLGRARTGGLAITMRGYPRPSRRSSM
jgi:hypothetical protein